MTSLVVNNAFSTLASGITNASSSLTVATGEGARFPAPSGGNDAYLTLIDNAGLFEIIKYTTRTSDTFSGLTRASDNTTAKSFSAGDKVELRIVAAHYSLPAIATAGTDYVAPVGSDGTVTRQMLKDCGSTYFDSNTTSALDYTNGSCQRWAPSGTVSLTLTGWAPTGNLSELLIQGINLGAATITWPTINWIKSDGTTTTTFSSNGVTLQSSGTDWVYLFTRDGGTTIYGKVIR